MQLEMLTDDKECTRICKDYWQQNEDGKFTLKVQEIAINHGMKPHLLSNYVKQHAYVWLATVCCMRCEEPYRFETRGQYQERNRYKRTVCMDCRKVERQSIADAKRSLLVKMRQSAESNTVDLTALGLKGTVYLLATIQALGTENFSSIEPLYDYPACTLSPDFAYDQKILRYLLDKHLLLISLNTRQEAVELHDNELGSISLGVSTFDLALSQCQITELINEFRDSKVIYNIRQTPEFIELCKEIQLNECIGFLKAMLVDHKLSLVPGAKTKQVLTQCLEKFSVAQTYNFIWRAATNAAAYYMRSNISKKQAANSVVGAISRYMEQSLANAWNVKSFERNYSFPQSSLSRIVFNTILGTDDGGFKQPLHELIEPENSSTWLAR